MQSSSSKIRLFLSAKNFPSSNCVKISLYEGYNSAPTTTTVTEKVEGNPNPQYLTTAVIDYQFHTLQSLTFELIDLNNTSSSKKVSCLVADLLRAHVQTLTLEFADQNKKGPFPSLIVKAEASSGGSEVVTLNFAGQYTNPGWCCFRPTTQLTLWRSMESSKGSNWQKVAETHRITSSMPNWSSLKVDLDLLTGNDYYRPIKVTVTKTPFFGFRYELGSFEFTLNDIFGQPGTSITETSEKYPLLAEKDLKFSINDPRVQNNALKLRLASVKIVSVVKFEEHLMKGTEISLIAAIDFTASNIGQQYSRSLHYVGAKKTPYEQALEPISEILVSYDTDKMVPLYGFGAGSPGSPVSHCFPLNGDKDSPEVCGVKGITETYRNALRNLSFSGPTKFSPLLRETIDTISKELKGLKKLRYYVLVILTDGQICDRQETIDQIVRATYEVPLSIVIVGIGNGPFGTMNELDADEQPLVDSKGRRALSDIVQFVEFRKFQNDGTRLAAEVLEEIPRQLEDCFASRSIFPGDNWHTRRSKNSEISYNKGKAKAE